MKRTQNIVIITRVYSILPGADPGIFERRGRKVGCPVGCRWWSLPGHAPPENVEFWIVRNTIFSILREFDTIFITVLNIFTLSIKHFIQQKGGPRPLGPPKSAPDYCNIFGLFRETFP